MSSAHLTKLKRKAAEFEQKKQFDKALALYVQVIDEAGHDIDDADLQLFNRVGDLLTRQSNVTEALAYYEKAVDFYAERGFLNNAIALCNKILRQSPARTAVYYKLGKISASKGFKTDARRNFLEYADRMQQAGKRDEAFRALKEFADLCPDQDDIRLMLADMLTREHRNAEAVEQLQQLYSQLLAEGRENEAHATLERIRAIDPDGQQPMQSGAMPVVKLNDLVFLDVETGYVPPPRPPTPLASRTVTPAMTPAVEAPRVGALEGLSLTYVPSGTPIAVPAIEGLEPTRTTPPVASEAIAVPDLIVPPRLTPAELRAIELAIETPYEGPSAPAEIAPVLGLDHTTRTPVIEDAIAALDGLEVDEAPPARPTPRSTPVIQLAIDAETRLPRLSVTGELLAIREPAPPAVPELSFEEDLVRAPTPFDLIGLEEESLGGELLSFDEPPADLLDPEIAIEEAFAASTALDEFVNADEELPSQKSGDDEAHGVALEFIVDTPAVDTDEELPSLEIRDEDAGGAVLEFIVDTPAADTDEASVGVGPSEQHRPDTWDGGIESASGLLDLGAGVAGEGVIGDERGAENLLEVGAEFEPPSASGDRPNVSDMSSGAYAAAFSGLTDDEPADAVPDALDAWLAARELEPQESSGTTEALAEADAVDASSGGIEAAALWREADDPPPAHSDVRDLSELWRDAGAFAGEASSDPDGPAEIDASNMDWTPTAEPMVVTDETARAGGVPVGTLPPEFALEDFVLDASGAPIAQPPEPELIAPLAEPAREFETPLTLSETPSATWQLPPVGDLALPMLNVNQGSDSLQVSQPLDSASIDELLSQSPSFVDSGEHVAAFEPAPLDLLGEDAREEWESPEVLIDGEWRDEHVGDLVSGEMFVVGERREVDRSPRPAFDDLSAAMMFDDDESNDDERPERLPTPAMPSAFSVRSPTPIGTLSFGGLDAQLRRRLELTPDDAALRRQLGEALLDIGRRDEGLAELEAARDQFERQGNLDQASDVLHVTLRVIPQSVAHHQKRVEYAVRANDRHRLVDAYIELADALFRSGEPDRSRVVYSRVVELAPNNERALFALSMLEDTVGPASRSDEIPNIPAGRLGDDASGPRSQVTFTPGDLAAMRQATEARRTPADLPTTGPSLGDAVRELLANDPTPDALRAIPTATPGVGPAVTWAQNPVDVAGPVAPVASAPAPGAAAGDFVDLGDWLREDVPVRSTRMTAGDVAPTGDEAADFAEMLRRFKAGIAVNVEDEDFASHYDLGVAYKEMGLLDEAIAEFQKSLRGPQHRIRSFEALGQCFVEKDQHEVAITLLARAANSRVADDDELVGVLYLLGQACEKVGRPGDAVGYFQRVLAVDIHFRDVGDRLAALSRTPK